MGSVDPDFANQIHDFNPGISESGLFWTVPIADDAVQVDLAAGTGEMHVRDLDVIDSYNVPNSLTRGANEPATISFDVYWSDPTTVEHLTNAEQSFAGTFYDVTSQVEWSGSTADFSFVSDPASTSQSLFGRLGFEVNGVYFPDMGATPTA